MSADRPSFRRVEPGKPQGAGIAVLAILAAAVVLAVTRPLWTPSMPDGLAVEVRGDVPVPGLHLVTTPTVRAAIEAAGRAPEGFPDGPLREGERVVVEGDTARVLPPSDPVLVGLPIDLNRCDAAALGAVPGLWAVSAREIVAWREAHGPFRSLADLEAVPGVGAGTIEKLAPFVTFGTAP